jgi:D-sedoheptulose 7-phosphate isomerase
MLTYLILTMRWHVDSALRDARDALESLQQNERSLSAISEAGALLATAIGAGKRAYSCGNGGSMSDAMHFAEELTGRFRKDRQPFAALAISDAAYLTGSANDFGYETVFARFIEAHGQPGDVLLAISTSGKSVNVIRAAEMARRLGLTVIALVGVEDTPLRDLATVTIATPGGLFSDRVQELHIKVIHILVELVERQLCPTLYSSITE